MSINWLNLTAGTGRKISLCAPHEIVGFSIFHITQACGRLAKSLHRPQDGRENNNTGREARKYRICLDDEYIK